MTALYVKRVGNTLVPDGDESVSAITSVPFGKSLKAEIKMQRNVQHHRLFFAMCKRIGDGCGIDAEKIATVFKIATDHYDVVVSKRHGEIRVPKSISFAKMDQTQFREFFERCVQTAYNEWRIDPADLADLLEPKTEKTR